MDGQVLPDLSLLSDRALETEVAFVGRFSYRFRDQSRSPVSQSMDLDITPHRNISSELLDLISRVLVEGAFESTD